MRAYKDRYSFKGLGSFVFLKYSSLYSLMDSHCLRSLVHLREKGKNTLTPFIGGTVLPGMKVCTVLDQGASWLGDISHTP